MNKFKRTRKKLEEIYSTISPKDIMQNYATALIKTLEQQMNAEKNEAVKRYIADTRATIIFHNAAYLNDVEQSKLGERSIKTIQEITLKGMAAARMAHGENYNRIREYISQLL
jgi:uncharacterized Rossmann fold enzyme